MPAYTIVALLALVAAGGAIAWLGDVIGYRLGKRRSSLLGLRPRTTARIVGIAAGAILPIIGLGVAALGSSYVQDALFNIQHLRNQQQSLLVQVRELNDTKNALKHDAEQARGEATQAREQADILRAQADVLEQNVSDLQQRVTRLQRERDGLQDEVKYVAADLRKAKASLERSQDQLGRVQAQNQKLEEQQTTLEANVTSLKGLLESTQGQVDVATRELETAVRELEPVQEELELKLDRLAELEDQLQELKIILTAWKDAFYGPVLYGAGHELVRNVIRSDQTLEQIESSLRENVVLASKIARGSGIVVEEGRSVQVLAPLPEGTRRLGEVTEDRIIRLVARTIQTSEEDSYVVSIKVLATVFAAQPEPEPVPVVLLPIANARVYARGETIVRTRIDGSEPRDQVFAQLWAILSTLRREAQQHGVLAHPETGQYGDVPAEQLLRALDELLSAGQPKTVRAVAAEDVYRVGIEPFLVRIEVGEEPES